MSRTVGDFSLCTFLDLAFVPEGEGRTVTILNWLHAHFRHDNRNWNCTLQIVQAIQIHNAFWAIPCYSDSTIENQRLSNRNFSWKRAQPRSSKPPLINCVPTAPPSPLTSLREPSEKPSPHALGVRFWPPPHLGTLLSLPVQRLWSPPPYITGEIQKGTPTHRGRDTWHSNKL